MGVCVRVFRTTLYAQTRVKDYFGLLKKCVNYDILTRTKRKHCLCTGMLYDPVEKYKHQRKSFKDYKDKYGKWLKEKRTLLFKKFKKSN